MIPKRWFNGLETAKKLGISYAHLSRIRPELEIGRHYRVISRRSARRKTYQYDPKTIEQWLLSP